MKDVKGFFLIGNHLNGLLLTLVLHKVLGPVLFLIYINDLSNGINSDVKLFADDTFSTVYAPNTTAGSLNKDLQKISEWAYKWKMSFNPDPTKQAQEVIFSRKLNKPHHPLLKFNKLPVQNASSQKHFGLVLDDKLDFESHLKEKCANLIKVSVLLKNYKILCQNKHFYQYTNHLLDLISITETSSMINLTMKVFAKS